MRVIVEAVLNMGNELTSVLKLEMFNPDSLYDETAASEEIFAPRDPEPANAQNSKHLGRLVVNLQSKSAYKYG